MDKFSELISSGQIYPNSPGVEGVEGILFANKGGLLLFPTVVLGLFI